MARGVLSALAATTAVVAMAPVTGSAAPLPSQGPVAAAGDGTWGWSYCYQYSYDDGITRTSNYNQNSWTASWANVGNIQNSGSGAGGTGYSQWSYSWVYGNGGATDCRPSADVFNVRAVHSNGTVTITGSSEQPATKVTISTPNGVVFCVATSARNPVAAGGYPFTCQAPWLLGPGVYALPVLAEKFGARPVETTTPLVVEAAPAVTVATVTPNPTAGPVTVAGTTTRPSATITVRNPDGSVLCTTTSSSIAVNGTYAWSCAGSIPAPDGSKTLTATMTTPNGETATTTVPVTRTTPQAPFAIVGAKATPNPTSGPVTVSGTTNRPNAAITVTNPGGSVLCTTTGSGTAVNGQYSFSCAGTVPAPDGQKTLTVKAVGPNGGTATTTVPVTRTTPQAPFAIVGAKATPNPTSGPVTVSGTTNRPNAAITVTNPGGSVLCTTTGSGTAVNGQYSFSCAGTVPAPDGQKTLTVKAVGPNGGTATTTVPVTRTSAQSPLTIVGLAGTPNPTAGPVTVSGTTNRPSAAVQIKNADGSVLCTTTSSATAVNGQYAFSCAGTLPGPDGQKTLTATATAADGSTASASTTATRTSMPSTLTILNPTASPNPTTGPVTVSGTTNRPGTKIEVKNPDGSVLCTTTGSTTAVNGWYTFSCAGTVPGPEGQKTLTVKATGPNGNVVTAQVPVTVVSPT